MWVPRRGGADAEVRTGTIALNDWPICQLNTRRSVIAVVADGRVLRPPPPGVPPSRLDLCLSDGAHAGRPGAEDLDRTWRRERCGHTVRWAIAPPGSGGHPPPVREWPVHGQPQVMRGSGIRACTRSRALGVPVFGGVGPPVAALPRSRAGSYTLWPARAAAHRRAVSGHCTCSGVFHPADASGRSPWSRLRRRWAWRPAGDVRGSGAVREGMGRGPVRQRQCSRSSLGQVIFESRMPPALQFLVLSRSLAG